MRDEKGEQLVKEAFLELYPEQTINFESVVVYSRSFKGYNARIFYTEKKKEFRLSYKWKEISWSIKKGIIQQLLNKIYKTRVKTISIELYDNFMKQTLAIERKRNIKPIMDPVLLDSFNRMNKDYFGNMMEIPNLVFGQKTFSTLGSYDYYTDTIKISEILIKDQNILDFVMYHEMIHKKLGFHKIGDRHIHHSKEFRKLEAKYHDKNIESKIKKFVRKEKKLQATAWIYS